MVMEVEKRLLVQKSPEEEAYNIAIKNGVNNRYQLISQLYV